MRRAIFAMLLLSACKGSDKPTTALPQIGAFKHDEHLDEGMKCGQCHLVKPEEKYALLRPGTNAHDPCDSCHAHEKDFYSEPGALCEVCHVSVDPLKRNNSPLKPYPQVRNTAQLVSSFDHAVHLKKEATATASAAAGLDCMNCHQIASKESAYASFPTHANCVECHVQTSQPLMSDCDACHKSDGPGRVRKFLRHLENDVRFTHGKHQTAPTGERVECRYCHENVDTSHSVADLNLPEMRVCSSCHDSELTPADMRMKNCGLCHTDDVTSKPLPVDHTL
jgi:hypothetical protein